MTVAQLIQELRKYHGSYHVRGDVFAGITEVVLVEGRVKLKTSDVI